MFVLYLLATQDRGTARSFGEELREAVSGPGGELMTYAEELIQEGERKGRQEGREEGRQEGEQRGVLKGKVGTIENLLQAGVQWSVIESATGIDQEALRALKQRLAGSDDEERIAPGEGCVPRTCRRRRALFRHRLTVLFEGGDIPLDRFLCGQAPMTDRDAHVVSR